MSGAANIARLRRELGQRLEEHAAQQALLQRRLDAILACANTDQASTFSDLGELIGRIADFRAGMDTNFAVETQALAAIEAALRGIRERA